MKRNLLKGLVIAGLAITAILTVSLTSVNAKSVYEEYSLETFNETYEVESEFSLEEMLQYAINDEYMAQAEYEAIIATFGEVMPFVKIVEAEQTHIDLLLPLFETYGFAVPANEAAANVIIPESITSALATGVDAEQANIAMYETFLAQDNLPDDVRDVFVSLVVASEHHLRAFSQDRYSYYGEDMMNQIKNQWQKHFGGENGSSKGSQNQGASKGTQNQSKGNAYQALNQQLNEDCPNA
jgi:hypothetical protein